MPKTITGDPQGGTTISAPIAGEEIQAETVEAYLQALANLNAKAAADVAADKQNQTDANNDFATDISDLQNDVGALQAKAPQPLKMAIVSVNAAGNLSTGTAGTATAPPFTAAKNANDSFLISPTDNDVRPLFFLVTPTTGQDLSIQGSPLTQPYAAFGRILVSDIQVVVFDPTDGTVIAQPFQCLIFYTD